MARCGKTDAARGGSKVHYTTAAERREAQNSLGLRRGVVIPLGIDEEVVQTSVAPERFRQRHPSLGQDPYVLMLCRLHPKKGLELFINAFLDVVHNKAFQRWRLVVAGDGEARYVGTVRQLVQQRGADRQILFSGWLAGSEKIEALQGRSATGIAFLSGEFWSLRGGGDGMWRSRPGQHARQPGRGDPHDRSRMGRQSQAF